jgi:hypothetical protein
MTPEPTFRQATANDAEAVLAIGHQLWDEMGERSGFTQRPTSEGIKVGCRHGGPRRAHVRGDPDCDGVLA